MAEPSPPSAQQAPDDQGQMPFASHIRELRDRIRGAVIALFFGFLIAYWFKQDIFVLLIRPLLNVWEARQAADPSIGDPQLVFKSLTEPFWTYFSLALWAGIFISSPAIFYQIWKFVAPGLYKRERHIGIIFAISSGVCFAGGAVFCYFLVLEPVYEFLLSYASANLSNMSKGLGIDYQLGTEVALRPLLSMQEYLQFARKLLLGFGLVFELPLLIFMLSITGLVTHRKLWKFNRWWIILSFVISAMLTPPDPASQLLMAGPLVVLYNISIIISFFVTRGREKRAAALDADPPDDDSPDDDSPDDDPPDDDSPDDDSPDDDSPDNA